MNDIDRIAPYATYFSRSIDDVARDLESYAHLLRKWQGVQNLVSRETLDQMWDRHFVDSLQVLKLVDATDQNFLDIGSGGGFPALPLAIALKDTGAKFTLVEPTSRKVSFLRTVSRELGLNVNTLLTRSDQINASSHPPTDVITSRALAALPQLCDWIAPFFGPRTRAILHKGREHVEEVKQTLPHWSFDVLSTPSDTDPNGVLLTISNLRKKSVS